MKITVLTWCVSFLPILLLIMLLAVFRVSTARAAGVTLLLTVLSALVVYKADIQLVLFESLKGVWSTATILYIIFPALLLYELIAASGAIDVMNDTMRQLSPHELFRILTVGWVFVGFLQGITGFGVPVAICVPMLVALGVRPTMAVIIALLGQAWGNTFGTLAVAWDVLVQISGITGTELHLTARYTALLLWILNLAAGALICWLYDRGRGLRQGAVFVLVISLIHGGGELLVAQYNASIAAFIPATVAMAAILPLSRLPMYRRAYACEGSPMMVRRTSATGAEKPRGAVWLYFAPYMVLILVTVVLLVIPSVHEALSRWSVGFAFPETRTAYGIVNAATAKYSPSGGFRYRTAADLYHQLRPAPWPRSAGAFTAPRHAVTDAAENKTRSRVPDPAADHLQAHERQRPDAGAGAGHHPRHGSVVRAAGRRAGCDRLLCHRQQHVLQHPVHRCTGECSRRPRRQQQPPAGGADRRRLRRQYDLPQQDHPGHHSRRRTRRRGHGTALHAADGSDPHFGHWGDLLDHPVIRKESKS